MSRLGGDWSRGRIIYNAMHLQWGGYWSAPKPPRSRQTRLSGASHDLGGKPGLGLETWCSPRKEKLRQLWMHHCASRGKKLLRVSRTV